MGGQRTALKEAGYEWGFLGPEHLTQVMKLQHLTAEQVPLPGMFHPMPEEYVVRQLQTGLNGIGVFKQAELICVHLISFPQAGEENFGRDIGLRQDELTKVAHMGAVAIHPAHRGKGLHREVGDCHLRLIKRNGCKHVCATASPHNYPSLRFLTTRGFRIREMCEKYEGQLRCILHLPLQDAAPAWREELEVDNHDLARQKALLRDGWQGYRVEKREAGFVIVFAKR